MSPVDRALARCPSEARCRAAAAHTPGIEAGATWPYLWPAGRRMAADLEALVPHGPPSSACDLGCGRGLLGLTLRELGCTRVIFADGDSACIHVLTGHLANDPACSVVLQTWGASTPGAPVDLLVAGDCCYRRAWLPALLDTIAASVSPTGQAWLADPRQHLEPEWPHLARARGLDLALERCSTAIGDYTRLVLRPRIGASPADRPR